MSIHNNFPATSWIKLDGISVTKGEDVYIVKDFKTNLKYIYWSSDNHDKLTASNVMLSRTSSRFLIAINNKGECVLVPNEEIVVSFDGNSVDAITEHIWGLYEKDEEFGNRFVSVEQNIEGITQTIGETQEELGKVSENVSKVDQKADNINLSVKNLSREYDNDKEMQELRENVNGSIIDVNSALGVFKSQITDIFKDNKISEDESVEIQTQIDILKERKSEVINQVDRVILLMELEENLSEVTKLTSQKQAFINAIDNLISLVSTAISDSTIVPTEVTVVTDAFGKASLEINTLKNTVDEIIFLGVGGTISEELAKISMKSDEIVLSVHKFEQKVDSDTASLKNELASQIKDVGDELNNLEDTMNTSFLDGVLSDSEKIALKTNLENLATEKLDVDKQYQTIYNNSDLTGTQKTELYNSYNTYTQKYNSLVSAINSVINKQGNVDINDQSNINSCIVAYRNALGDFSEKASKAIDAIAKNKVNTVDKKYAEIVLDPETGITSKVGKNNIISSINQTAESIKINAGKVNLNGYVTMTNLKTEGQTTIHGGNIDTDTISVNSLKSNNNNPIIKLFQNSNGYCSIDATKQYETDIGSWIRLKWDKYNYWYVGENSAGVYLGRNVNIAEGNEYDSYFWVSTTHARIRPNKFMVGTGNCRIDTTDGAIRLYTTAEGSGDRGLRINIGSGRLEVYEDEVGFTKITNTATGTGTYRALAFSDHTHQNYISTSSINTNVTSTSTTQVASASAVKTAYDRADSAYSLADHDHPYASSTYFTSGYPYCTMKYTSTNYVQAYGGGEVELRAGSARAYLSNYGAWAFYPANSSMDLGADNSSGRWRYIYAQSNVQTSDLKYKEDINYLDDITTFSNNTNTPFLDFIKNDFKPATYMYKTTREDEGHVEADKQIGFVANDIYNSDVGRTFLYNYGTEEETDLMFSPTGYTTVVARALQEEIKKRDKEISELNEKNLMLENKVEELSKKIDSLTDIINKLINN